MYKTIYFLFLTTLTAFPTAAPPAFVLFTGLSIPRNVGGICGGAESRRALSAMDIELLAKLLIPILGSRVVVCLVDKSGAVAGLCVLILSVVNERAPCETCCGNILLPFFLSLATRSVNLSEADVDTA